MQITLRQEIEADYEKVRNVVQQAFESAPHSDGNEAQLVENLRTTREFIPELSLVAEMDGEIVGHILFSLIHIQGENKEAVQSLALAPVSVLPKFQNKGIGGKLMEEGHALARALGYRSIILLGYPEYYSRFGYASASRWGIRAPFPVPDEAFMALELVRDGLRGVSGVVRYPEAFEPSKG